jgi:N-acetylmuramic acid 6-phosphate etherase
LRKDGFDEAHGWTISKLWEKSTLTKKMKDARRTKATGDDGYLLGIEGGGTRTVFILTTSELAEVARKESGPGNIRLLADSELEALLRQAPDDGKPLRAIAIGLAGAREPADRERILTAAAKVWPGTPCHATHDLETALAAAELQQSSVGLKPRQLTTTRVLVLSGTGACCWGRTPAGNELRVGGWGHLLGDRGSAYAVAHDALRCSLAWADRSGVWPELGARLLRSAGLAKPDDLVAWMQTADKSTVAGLAVEVFAAAASGDRLAKSTIAAAADALAADAMACAQRLGCRGTTTTFVFAGSCLTRQPLFAKAVASRIRKHLGGTRIIPLPREGAWGAVLLASRLKHGIATCRRKPGAITITPSLPALPNLPLTALVHSPTEQRNPRSIQLDRLSIPKAVDLFLSEEPRVVLGLIKEKAAIVKACQLIRKQLIAGGRLLYIGAGTSGRLGVLDASECPPTFCSPPELVQGIIAGGYRALVEAVEGAEDDAEGGGAAIVGRGVSANDVVVGVAASGRTPFVWGALQAAHAQGAGTILVCFNPRMKQLRHPFPKVLVAADVGPELLTGSTRLKAGTATKLILNIFSTLGMVSLGKVYSNWMIDLNPSNTKLRDRARRLLQSIAGVQSDEAQHLLEQNGWKIRPALKQAAPNRRKQAVSRRQGKAGRP